MALINPVWHIDDMTAPELRKWLIKNNACHEARAFCKRKSLKQAWAACERYSWMNWYLSIIGQKKMMKLSAMIWGPKIFTHPKFYYCSVPDLIRLLIIVK